MIIGDKTISYVALIALFFNPHGWFDVSFRLVDVYNIFIPKSVPFNMYTFDLWYKSNLGK